MASDPPKVLVSYSHDSPEHVQRVLTLAGRLREDGIDCMIDQYVAAPEEGWTLWTKKQIRDSEFILMVCTETYLKSVRGTRERQPRNGRDAWEGHLIDQALYRDGTSNTKFIPVLFEVGDSSHYPVRNTHFYLIDTEHGYEDLLRRLTNQPWIMKPELGQRRSLPLSERKSEGFADQVKGSIGETNISLLRPEQPFPKTPNLHTRRQQQMPTDSKARVFVSHSSKDKPFVRKLVEALNKHLLNIWVDEHEIKVGDSLVGKISEALKDADYLVIVLSQASVSSRWVEQELNAALTNQISGKGVVLPVLLEDCELPMLLRDRLYADFRADFNVGLEALVAAFEHEGEAATDVATLGPRTAAPASFTPAGLRENLQGLLSDRMTRAEVGRLWYAVLETGMDDEVVSGKKAIASLNCSCKPKTETNFPDSQKSFAKSGPISWAPRWLIGSCRRDAGEPSKDAPKLARLTGVPDLPPHYLPREADLAGLKQKLLSGDASVAITGQGQALGVQGMGGIGKTVLAAALAHDPQVRQAFPDGIYWLTIGQKPNLLDLQNQLLRQVTGSKETLTTEQEAKDALREALEGRTALIVVDDAWTVNDTNAFSAPRAHLLITTRNNEVLVGLGAEEHRVDVLSPGDALKMLAEWVGQKSPDKLPPEAAEVARECGCLPLALAMIGAMIRLQPTAWKDALDCLRASDLEEITRAFPGYPYPNLLRAIEVSVEALDASDRERYLDLAVFPEDQPIPETALSVLWKLDARRARGCMARLIARSLATRSEAGGSEALILHDLQCDLIRKRRIGKLPDLHLRLVKAWDALPKLGFLRLAVGRVPRGEGGSQG